MEDTQQFSGPRTTAQSKQEERIKVDVGQAKKKAVMKILISKVKC